MYSLYVRVVFALFFFLLTTRAHSLVCTEVVSTSDKNFCLLNRLSYARRQSTSKRLLVLTEFTASQFFFVTRVLVHSRVEQQLEELQPAVDYPFPCSLRTALTARLALEGVRL